MSHKLSTMVDPTATFRNPARSFGVAIAVFALILSMIVASAPAARAVDDPFRFEGNGWGHGIGLSQYGAQARALDGQTASEIVEYYYTGSTVTSTPNLPSWFTSDDAPLWVGLLEDQTRFDFTADSGILGLCQGSGPCPDPDIGAPVPGEDWSLRLVGTNTCQFYKTVDTVDTPMGPEDNCWARILLGDDDTDTRVTLTDKGHTYARGQIIVRPVTTAGSNRFHVMVELAMEDYMLGISEVVLSWHPQALQAQTLASRTFAGNRAVTFGPESGFSNSVIADCWCHVEDGDGADQVYNAWDHESYTVNEIHYGAYWIDAVEATAGQYITHPDGGTTAQGLILAFFGSSNGGATETNGVGFGNSTPTYPYLMTVPDPYSLLGNPQAPWKTPKLASSSTVASKLPELTQVDRIRVMERHPSGSAKVVLFEGKNGSVNASTTRDGRWSRGAFGLRSAWITQVCRERGLYTDDDCSIFETNIFSIASAGFIGSMPNNEYKPNDDMTRSSMAAFLAAGMNLPASSTNHFPDDDGDPNEAAINSLADAGVVVGYEDGTYRPNNTVTRAEMALYLAGALDVDLPESVSPDPFPDVPGGSWFGPAVAEILSRGITVGHEDGTYQPNQVTTRGQMAAFIDRGFLGGI